MDTICALSSGSLPAGIAVIRVSGPQARFVGETMVSPLPVPRRASVRSVRDPSRSDTLDQAMVLWMPGPGSVTGEDMLELHCHGGLAVVAAVLRAMQALPGVRLAEAGEFTRRAYQNGRLDLTAVEGFADLIAAETEAQRRQALRQAEGGLGRRLEDWRTRLVRARAWIEAEFDFTDEADVPAEISVRTWIEIAAIADEMAVELRGAASAERVRRGVHVAVLGPPNAGKSSLVNALARREVAIVSPEAGTTRDVLDVHLDLGGIPVVFSDTAGVRDDAVGPIEVEGIRRARGRAAQADLVLWLSPAADPVSPDPGVVTSGVPVWLIASRADEAEGVETGDALVLSVRTGVGIDALVTRLAGYAASVGDGGTGGLLTRERHRASVQDAHDRLIEAVAATALPTELRSELIRRAGDALARVTGRIGVEDLLDVIFREFCIGK
jgi:tRNA modification GTPase